MKKYLKLTAAVLSAFIMLTGCGGDENGFGGMGMPNGEEMQEESATPVKTVKLELSSISNEYMYSGSIEPSDEVDVTCKLSGEVAKVNFDVGDTVNEGDILFVMDTEDIEKDIKLAQASVKSAQTGVDSAENNLKMANGASMQSQLDNAKNSITNAESSLERAKISLDNAQTSVDNAQIMLNNSKINLGKAKKTYEDNSTLYDGGVISEEEFTNSKIAYDEAKNSYSQAELSLQQAKNQYSIEQSQYDSAIDSLSQAQRDYELLANETSQENTIKAEDNLKQSQAQLESSNIQLEKTMQSLNDAYVRAPISGVVSKCNVTAGANLSMNEASFVIINTNSVNVKVNVAEQMVNSIKQGDNVRIIITSLDSKEITGKISYVSPDANSDGTYEVKVNIENNDGSLKGGMFTEVYFTKEKSDNAIVIDRDAVISKNGEEYVFVVEGDTVTKTNVEIGIDNGDTVEITSGLSEGQTIVTEGQSYLKDGEKIKDVTNKTSKTEREETANESNTSAENDKTKD